jgi:hypothetical protein
MLLIITDQALEHLILEQSLFFSAIVNYVLHVNRSTYTFGKP